MPRRRAAASPRPRPSRSRGRRARRTGRRSSRPRRWRGCGGRRSGSRASISTPPRGCTSRSAARASSSRGRTPTVKTTTSVRSYEPSRNSSPVTWPERSGSRRVVLVPVLTRMPRRFDQPLERVARRCRSSWADMSRSEDCTTVHATSRPCSAPAASRPSRPPPMTVPVSGRPSSRGAALDERAQTLDVVERAVDEAAVEAEAVDGEPGGVGAGREHQPVVGDAQPALGA